MYFHIFSVLVVLFDQALCLFSGILVEKKNNLPLLVLHQVPIYWGGGLVLCRLRESTVLIFTVNSRQWVFEKRPFFDFVVYLEAFFCWEKVKVGEPHQTSTKAFLHRMSSPTLQHFYCIIFFLLCDHTRLVHFFPPGNISLVKPACCFLPFFRANSRSYQTAGVSPMFDPHSFSGFDPFSSFFFTWQHKISKDFFFELCDSTSVCMWALYRRHLFLSQKTDFESTLHLFCSFFLSRAFLFLNSNTWLAFSPAYCSD